MLDAALYGVVAANIERDAFQRHFLFARRGIQLRQLSAERPAQKHGSRAPQATDQAFPSRRSLR